MQPHVKSKGLLDHSVGGHVQAGESYRLAATREGEEELGLKGQVLQEIAIGVYSDEQFGGVLGEFHMRPRHMFGIYECHPDSSWAFEPNDEVAEIVPEEIDVIVARMNAEPGKFTPGFINTMARYIEIKDLPLRLDLTACRRNWEGTR
jgi:ADP-ribose pyrophosphatase YjhB (NUDIX family)